MSTAAYSRKWRIKNPEKVQQHRQRSYLKHKPKRQAEGRAYYQKVRERILTTNRANPFTVMLRAWKKKFGLTETDVMRMWADQAGLCPICTKSMVLTASITQPQKCCVDHDHYKQKGDNGFVRGLLCSGCNSLLGYAHDEVKRLQLAVLYLREHGKE